ncbi:MAG: alpha-amylase [Chlorobiaceae bacterium]|nr:alpha-amylase [Chlorobiaceae bacterium]NTW74937.1 alpha-amylase [Chlorobiaceae bacterium]
MTTSALETLLNSLRSASRLPGTSSYAVPNLWKDGTTGSSLVDPVTWYDRIISDILTSSVPAASNHVESASEWTAEAVVYNLFVRLGTAFDHNLDGTIGIEPLPSGFRETGTLLKAIAMLPYIRRMGANTIYLLPLTAIGTQNSKGALGSPYAIKSPYRLDPMLDEPALALPLETQLSAFVEAAHRLGMRVLFEFVFRTASVDSDWVTAHPDWFYWLRDGVGAEPYGPPGFDHDTLARIYEKVDKHDFRNLPAPDESYRNRFVESPASVSIVDGALQGVTSSGITCHVASAFSDWPPDDHQPPWTDVAYLKMHRHPGFNYIAYNTIRMYDEELDIPEMRNTELWDEIAGIIPWYQEHYGIDGAMIDMGHALPPALKASIVAGARTGRPDFAFWDENFDPSPKLKEEGFDAVFGSLPFVIQDIQYIKGLLNFLNKNGVAIPFFATGENHNTPRVCHHLAGQPAGRRRALFLFTLGAILPAMPFIHSGMELCEWHPVNLGLNFTDEDRHRFPAGSLPLFSPGAYDWQGGNGLDPLCGEIRRIVDIRHRYLQLIRQGGKGSIIQPYISDPALIAIMRKSEGKSIIFAGNSNMNDRVHGVMEFEPETMELEELLSGRKLQINNHRLELEFEPGQCILFELPAPSIE